MFWIQFRFDAINYSLGHSLRAHLAPQIEIRQWPLFQIVSTNFGYGKPNNDSCWLVAMDCERLKEQTHHTIESNRNDVKSEMLLFDLFRRFVFVPKVIDQIYLFHLLFTQCTKKKLFQSTQTNHFELPTAKFSHGNIFRSKHFAHTKTFDTIHQWNEHCVRK